MITLHRTNSDNADFRAMVTLLDHDLKIRDGEDHSFYAQFNTLNRINHALVAYNEGIPVGSGAIRQYNTESMEIKRMFVKPEYRGMGVARLVLKELEAWMLYQFTQWNDFIFTPDQFLQNSFEFEEAYPVMK